MDKVSIIIPVYNAEKYLKQCLESILEQTYTNIEIIIINDGSTDNSKNIIEKYKNEFSEIKIVNQANSGVSNSRNVGINISTGNYIMFVDSDDIIIKDYIEQLMSILKKYGLDVIKSSFKNFKEDSKKYTDISFYKDQYRNIDKDEINKLFIETTNFNSSCMQIISKKIIDDNNITFEKNIGFAEDFLFTYKVFQVANKIGYVNNNGYVCRENTESNSRTGQIDKQIKNCLDTLQTYKILYNEKNIEAVSNKILLHITYLIRTISVKNTDYKSFRNKLNQFFNTDLWKNFKTRKFKIKSNKKVNGILSKFIYKEKILLIYFYVNIFQIYLKVKR